MGLFPSPGLFAAFVAASVLLALTPGPDMALYLSRTFGGGRSHGLAALGGALSGVVVHTFAAALGLSALIAASASAYHALKIAGALYLVYLAWGALKHGAALKLETGGAAGSRRSAFLAGVLINLTNPKVILFFVTFLPQFIDAGEPDPSRKLFVLGFSFIVVGGVREFARGMDGTQEGDPDKAARAVASALEAKSTPLRLQLGAESVAAVRGHAERLLEDLASWERVALDTRVDGATA